MSVRVVTDENGDVVKRINYDDYGRPTNPVLLRDTRTQIGFQGRLWDSQAGLYDFRTRHYDPAIGRFLQRDSIGTWGDPLNMGNAYSFVGNAPWVYTDPYGLQTNSFSRGGHPTGALGRRIISQNQFLSDGDYINHLEQSKAKTLGAIHVGSETVKAYGNASRNTLEEGAPTVAAVAIEPLDYVLSANDAINDLRSGNYLGACATVVGAVTPGVSGQVGKKGADVVEDIVKKIPHGNTLDDRPATLYKKVDKDGNLLKWGITKHKDPRKRYTKAQIGKGDVVAVDRNARIDISRKERDLVETDPGPENRERWAGKRK